jgi:hypothetical protein
VALLACPSCKRPFTSVVKLRHHFLGENDGDKEVNNGCCWNLINRKQQGHINSVLEHEVQSHLFPLLQLVVSESKAKKEEHDATIGTECPVINWKGVLGILEGSLESSRKSFPKKYKAMAALDGTHNGLLETLQVTPSGESLLINERMVENIRRRIVERYGNAPR